MNIRHHRLTASTIVAGLSFLGGLIVGIPLLIGRLFFYRENSVHTTKYVFFAYLAFFLILMGVVIPFIRWIARKLDLGKTYWIDKALTVLVVTASLIPMTLLCIVTLPLLRVLIRKKYVYTIFHYSISVTIFLLGVLVRYKGKPYAKKHITIANHSGLMDYALLPHAMIKKPWNILAGINLKKNKPTLADRFIAWSIGTIVEKYSISIDRPNDASRQNSLRKIINELDEGKNIAIFPEGTRITFAKVQSGEVLQEFQDGIFKIAWNNNIPIQPIVFDWPVIWRAKNDFRWGFHPTGITASYLGVFYPEEYASFEELKQACWYAMKSELDCSEKVQKFIKSIQ